MNPWAQSALVFLGAGIGGNARHWLGGFVSSRTPTDFPWGTFTINVTGCFLIGLIAEVLLSARDPQPWRLLLITGVLGGYTTFSSFSLETARLLLERSYLPALANIAGSCVLGLAATGLGMILARAIVRH